MNIEIKTKAKKGATGQDGIIDVSKLEGSHEVMEYVNDLTRKIQREIENLFIKEACLIEHKDVVGHDDGTTIEYIINWSLVGED